MKRPKTVYRSRRKALFVPHMTILLFGIFSLVIGLMGAPARYHVLLVWAWVLIMSACMFINWWRMTTHIDDAIEASAKFERDLCDKHLRPIHRMPGSDNND